MTPQDMARIHGRAEKKLRPWSEQEFSDLSSSGLVFFLHEPMCFAVARSVADETELLLIATDPDAQRKGLATQMLKRFETQATAKGARRGFLEVAATNDAALALYTKAGWAQVGTRRNYYRQSDGIRVDALLFSRAFSPA